MASVVYAADWMGAPKYGCASTAVGFFHGRSHTVSMADLNRSHKVSLTTMLPPEAKKVEKIKVHFQPHEQMTHSMPPEKVEIIKSLEDWAENNILIHLKSVEKSWQPQDFLPDPSSEDFIDEVKELWERSLELPDDYLVCLVGHLITEEALPTYQTMLNTLDGVRDETGASPTSWATWTRMWTAEENRHGDLLNKYLYLSGRVDMRQIEKTIQYLIGSGMHIGIEHNPYLGFVYTSFQERATFISHANTARFAKGRKAQDYVCKLAPRIRRLDGRAQERAKQGQTCTFSWIFNKEILL